MGKIIISENVSLDGGEATGSSPLRLVGNRTVDGDLAYLTYQPARDA